MGSAVGHQYLTDEKRKPLDVSDIPDGDWEGAKAEIARVRGLLAKLQEQEESQKTHSTHNGNASGGHWSSRSHIDDTTSEEQSTLAPLPTAKIKAHEAHRLENMKKHSSGGSINRGTTSFHDGDDLIAPPVSGLLKPQESMQVVRMNELLTDIKDKVFERWKTLQEAFMKIDEDKSGYISRVEFRSAMEELGIKMTEEEFDLVNATYPHQEASGQPDKGIGYLEFVSLITGQLTYVPGAGEAEVDDEFLAEANEDADDEDYFAEDYIRCSKDDSNAAASSRRTSTDVMWGGYSEDKKRAKKQRKLSLIFSKRIFNNFYSMNEAFAMADKDNSGYIDKDELKVVLNEMVGVQADDADIDTLLTKFDVRGDGKLAYPEFVKCLQVS